MSAYEPVEILLAEDNPTDAEVALRALRKANLGNHVVWLKDGAETLDFLLRTGAHAGRAGAQPRLVLLDLKMPRLDGLEVLQRLRADPATRTLPVVMMTSSDEESDIVRSYDLGANSYVVKPVDFGKLSEEVARLGYYWLVMNRVPS